jgi:signal transduction histidine kinase
MDRLINLEVHPELSNIRTHVSNIIEDVRSLAWELRPSVLDDLGVVPAIRTYIENYTEHYGIQVKIDTNLRRRLSAQIETTIYRTIQEALTNIGKYADVDEAQITLYDSQDQIEVRIQDKGKGFLRDTSAKGVGLFSMEERTRAIGGQLIIHSELGQGTEVVLIIPNK